MNRFLFTHLAKKQEGSVTFRDENSTKIIGKRTVEVLKIPKINVVLYAHGLKHNLISITQIYDKGYMIQFAKDKYEIKDKEENETLVVGIRTNDNCYVIDPTNNNSKACLISQTEESNIWHQRLGHINFKDVIKLSKKELVMSLPNLNKLNNLVCKGCQMGKQIKIAHKKLTLIGTSRPLGLLHIDLAGPTRMESLRDKRYFFVIVDDFSRYTWVTFLREKSEAFDEFMNICMRMQVDKDFSVKKIRNDHEGEFENHKFSFWCDEMGIKHEFSAPKIPQQNGVTERKNRTLLNMATCMLTYKDVSKMF